MDAEEERRRAMEQTAKRRFFYTQSFEAYGGVSGFFDYGPYMCALQNNFLSLWRRHFVLEECMYEVETSIITPFEVLKASGHVEKFSDLMCSDTKTGELYRADHLAKEWLEREIKEGRVKEAEKIKEIETIISEIGSYSQEEIQIVIDQYNMKSNLGNDLGRVAHFNLMFNTVVGPGGKTKSFLRPETAQGQFLNFKRLLEANGEKMPFASATVGKAFRNEISPRAGLLRVREFLMAEIEHYVHPKEKQHGKFNRYKDRVLPLLFAGKDEREQKLREVSIGEAVTKGIVDNETLGYFMARVHMFLVQIGVPEKEIRFRQHLPTEMAHYASDCWDAEINTAFGWIECVGIADRSCYDLSVHGKHSGEKIVARRALSSPIHTEVLVLAADLKKIGQRFRGKAPKLLEIIKNMPQEEIKDKQTDGVVKIEYEGETVEIAVEKKKVVQHIEEYIPSVIEPSFGVGRLLYALLWHSFYTRAEDGQRGVFRFNLCMSPVKCMVLPLQDDKRFSPIISGIQMQMVSLGIACQIDESRNSIGRRYARADEVGTSFCVTVDFDTLEDRQVTIRERDSTAQKRVSLDQVAEIINALITEKYAFKEIL